MTPGEDMAEFAGQLDQLGRSGGFDPLAFIAGETRLAGIFIAPFSPSLQTTLTRFLTDGTGAFSDLPALFTKQGMRADQAQQHVRQLCTAARGMLVCVLASDQSLTTMPLFYFGQLDSAYCQHVLGACANAVADKQPLSVALEQLRAKVIAGGEWPQLIVGKGQGKPYACWLEIAGRLVVGHSSLAVSRQQDRLSDLAHWCAKALSVSNRQPDAATVLLQARCHVLAGEQPAAMQCLDRLLAEDGQEEAFAEAAVHLADAAIRAGRIDAVDAWLERTIPIFEQRSGTCYDLRLAAFKVCAASARSGERLLMAAQALIAANRKCARQDLTREPLWQVMVPDSGPLLDTEAAAAAITRSPVFIAKRLEHGTIPSVRLQVAGQQDQVRIPQAALMAWKQVMDVHKLLD